MKVQLNMKEAQGTCSISFFYLAQSLVRQHTTQTERNWVFIKLETATLFFKKKKLTTSSLFAAEKIAY